MKILSDASVWFIIGILCLLASFVLANYGISNLFPAMMIGLSIAVFLVAIVINARKKKRIALPASNRRLSRLVWA